MKPVLAERIQRALQGFSNPAMELALRRPDGALVTVESTSLPITWRGRPAALVINHDITKAKRSYIARRSSLTISEMVEALDPDQILEYGLEEGIRITDSGMGFLHFVHPDQNSIELQRWCLNTLKTCRTDPSSEHYPISQAGIWVECVSGQKPVICNNYSKVAHKKGLPEGHVPLTRLLTVPIFERTKVAAIIGVGNKPCDYDELDVEHLTLLANTLWSVIRRTRAETALRQSEEKYRQLVQNINSIILRFDSEQRIIFLNEYGCRFFGYSEHEVLGKKLIGTLLPPKDTMGRDLNQMLGDLVRHPNRYDTNENENILKNGDKVWVAWNNKPLYDDQGNFKEVLSVGVDITSLKKLETQLRQTQKLESLGAVAGGVAHDFNNLLAGILGYTELAMDDLPLGSAARSHLERAENLGRKAACLTEQMLHYSGQGCKATERADLSAIIGQMGSLLQSSLPKRITLRLDLATGSHFIEADASQIKQVVLNLVTNACEAMAEKSGSILIETGEMDCSASFLKSTYIYENQQPGRYGYLKVTDNGPGMEPSIMERLFDPFFSTKFIGRGLGLAAVLGIVRGHRGAILVKSGPQAGSSFQVFFPAMDSPTGEKGSSKGVSRVRAGGNTILLVDDEEYLLEMTRIRLESHGYTIFSALNGLQALQVFKQKAAEIDLIILDWGMPDMDGEEVLAEIRKYSLEVPVLICSGYSQNELGSSVEGLGVTAYIQKPYKFTELEEILTNILGPARLC